MSVAQTFLRQENIKRIVEMYLSEEKPTLQQVADRLATRIDTISHVLRITLPEDQYRAEKKIRYSRSKQGEKNPMLGKFGELHHRYVGERSDGHGYLTKQVGDRGYFVHRLVFADLLGIPIQALPDYLEVHHIDENPLNNHPDNLALVTARGHQKLHFMKKQQLPRFRQRGSAASGTSK